MSAAVATIPGAALPEPSDRVTISAEARLRFDGLASNVERLRSTLRASSATAIKADEADKLLAEIETAARMTRTALRRGLRS